MMGFKGGEVFEEEGGRQEATVKGREDAQGSSRS